MRTVHELLSATLRRTARETARRALATTPPGPIVFVLGGPVFFRFVDGVVRELARGRRVIVLAPSLSPAMERCASEAGGMVELGTYDDVPFLPKRLVTATRHLRSYCHWLRPERRWSEFLLRRWATTEVGFPRSLRGCVKVLGFERFNRWIGALPLEPLLRLVDEWIPPNPRVLSRVRALAPAAVVCTPFIYPSPRRYTTEVEYLKAASRLGVPTAVLVASWDNLSMKGIFYLQPRAVLVWNEDQRDEARVLHGISPDAVFATGAPVFDPWFAGALELPREEFLARAGLKAEDRYLLYAESSAASGDESTVVQELASALDVSGAPRSLKVMVRRHPGRRDAWRPVEHERLFLYPATSVVPDTEEERVTFFNSIRHAAAVIGLNTTVFLEAAVVGRPCISIVEPERRHFQDGLLHFRYLREGGFVDFVDAPLEAARSALARLDGVDPFEVKQRAFVQRFLRPLPRDVSASRATADAIAAMAGQR